MSDCVREPTKKELLYDIRQLLYKLVYGNEAEGLKPITSQNKGNNKDFNAELIELQAKVLALELKVSALEQRELPKPLSPYNPYVPPVTWNAPFDPPYDPNNPQVICSTESNSAESKPIIAKEFMSKPKK